MSPGSSASSPPTASTAASTQKLIVPMNVGRLGACASMRDIAVVERRGEVEHLVDHGRERGAHERALHLLGGRVQALADDLRRDRIYRGREGALMRAASARASAPLECTSATKPASR